MNNMTWAQLKNHIETMDDKQLNTNVTAYITEIDEFISVDDINYVSKGGDGELDPFHPFLIVDY